MVKHLNLLVPLMLLVPVSAFTKNVSAETIAIQLTAEVTYIDDWCNNINNGCLQGRINVGDVVTATYVYESTTPDSNTAITVGDYWHQEKPYGITVNIGGYLFRTDPENVNFLVEIVNDHGEPAQDAYVLVSYNNIFDLSTPHDPDRFQQTYIYWALADGTSTAHSSDALPTVPPNLTDYTDYGLEIWSYSDTASMSHTIRILSSVTSVELIKNFKLKDKDKKPK